ncbi:hypothetical protein ABZ027_19530 [Streptomyces sp. NPDC006332]|uniref:hypothetical protein n=1 Tax=Streptomyces sp. NPDC006332 TaxID=3155456 RepID=UPI0033A3C2A8
MRRSARALSAAVLAGTVIGLAGPAAIAEPTAGPAAEQPAAEQPAAEQPAAAPAEEWVEEQPVADPAEEQPVAQPTEEQSAGAPVEEQSVEAPLEDPAAGPVAEALADPAAQVSPSSVSPGGDVTVSVSCDPTGGTPPGSITATSEAVDSGSVQLGLVSGDEATGPAYRGTAHITPDATLEGAGEAGDTAGKESPWTVDGTCPTAPGGHGKQWSAPFTVNQGSHGAAVQHGVRAGEGGAFTDSTPALVAGGLLIAGALGAAVHRLRRKEPATDD